MAAPVLVARVSQTAKFDSKHVALPAGISRPLIYFQKVSFPLCFISSGSHETTIAPAEVMVHKNITYCSLPVWLGAGYDTSRLETGRISNWSISSSRYCCLAQPAKHTISATVMPTGHTVSAQIGAQDASEYRALMNQHIPTQRGYNMIPLNTPPLIAVAHKTRCGLNTKTIAIFPNGVMTLEELQQSFICLSDHTSAMVEDVSYIRFTEAGLVRRLFCGGANKIEFEFLAGERDGAMAM